jgi:hypothetical protein
MNGKARFTAAQQDDLRRIADMEGRSTRNAAIAEFAAATDRSVDNIRRCVVRRRMPDSNHEAKKLRLKGRSFVGVAAPKMSPGVTLAMLMAGR